MKQKYLRNKDELDFKSGDIVFFVEKAPFRSESYPMYHVSYGRIDERYFGECSIDYLIMKETRTVSVVHSTNIVPIDDFVSETTWHKLPKGWTYNTELYTVTSKDIIPLMPNPKDPLAIIEAYKSGLLVKKKDIFWGRIDAEITKKGYRVVKTYPDYIKPRFGITLNVYDLYRTYEEAQAEADNENAEFIRQSNLTDLEWSIEEIDHQLNHYCKLYGIGDYSKCKMREYIMGLPDLENIETRIYMGTFQWKNWRKRKWNTVKTDW